jgi:hypothetical protein
VSRIDPRTAHAAAPITSPAVTWSGVFLLGSCSSGVGGLAGGGGAGTIDPFPALPEIARGEAPERSNGAVSKIFARPMG